MESDNRIKINQQWVWLIGLLILINTGACTVMKAHEFPPGAVLPTASVAPPLPTEILVLQPQPTLTVNKTQISEQTFLWGEKKLIVSPGQYIGYHTDFKRADYILRNSDSGASIILKNFPFVRHEGTYRSGIIFYYSDYGGFLSLDLLNGTDPEEIPFNQNDQSVFINPFSLSASPDLKWLAFSATALVGDDDDAGSSLTLEDTPSIYILSLADHSVFRLTTSLGVETTPAWSPDGKYLLYSVDTDHYNSQDQNAPGNFDLYMLAADCLTQHPAECEGQAKKIPLPDEIISADDPAWSPDGQQIIFECMFEVPNDDYPGSFYSQSDICRVSRLDWAWENITNSPDEDEYAPIWSPDGNSIAFIKAGKDFYDVFTMNVHGEGIKNITNTPNIAEALDFWAAIQ